MYFTSLWNLNKLKLKFTSINKLPSKKHILKGPVKSDYSRKSKSFALPYLLNDATALNFS